MNSSAGKGIHAQIIRSKANNLKNIYLSTQIEPGNQKSLNLSKYVSTQLSSYLKYIILCTKEQGEHHVFEIQKEQQFREKGRRRKKTPGSFCGSFV